jgi:hypothetical protein
MVILLLSLQDLLQAFEEAEPTFFRSGSSCVTNQQLHAAA